MSDVMVHIDESLPVEELSRIEIALASREGIRSVTLQEHTPHLMLVEYDHGKVDAGAILAAVRDQGVHAELVGL